MLSKNLKKRFEERYAHVDEKTTTAHLTPTRVSRKDMVVDVMLKKSNNGGLTPPIDDQIQRHNSIKDDQSDQPHLQQLPQPQLNIECFSKNNVIICGDPGIGKSTLAETMVYHWSMDKNWSSIQQGDHHLEFKFVFVLYFRELNRYASDPKVSAKKFLQEEYAEIFENIKFRDLKRMKEKVLLVLDGFDECDDHEQLGASCSHHQSRFLQSIYDLINPDNSKLPFQRVITSRPAACSQLTKMLDKCHFKVYEITGFSPRNVRRYIELYFAPSKRVLRVSSVISKINSSKLLSAVVHIPFYCWGICCILENCAEEDIPETYTSMYTHLLLLLLRNHGNRCSKSRPLYSFLEERFTQKTIHILSKLAFKTLIGSKLSFTRKDLKSSNDGGDTERLLLKSGLLYKTESDFKEPTFHFLHFTFHEFLAAVYVLRQGAEVLLKYISTVTQSDSTVLSLVLGLLGGLLPSSQSSSLVITFAGTFAHKSFSKGWSAEKFIGTYLRSEGVNRTKTFLSCAFEYHNRLSFTEQVDLFGDFNNDLDYKSLCLHYLCDSLNAGLVTMKRVSLFCDHPEWTGIVPHVDDVTLHVMPSSESLLSALPFDVLVALKGGSLQLHNFRLPQNICLDYVYEFLPFIERAEIVCYAEDLVALRSILASIEPGERFLRGLVVHLAEECDPNYIVDLSSFIRSITVVVRGNTTCEIHACSKACIKDASLSYLDRLYDRFDRLDDNKLGCLSKCTMSVSCWFESEDINYIYLIKKYEEMSIHFRN